MFCGITTRLVDAPLQFGEETPGHRQPGCEPGGESSEGDS